MDDHHKTKAQLITELAQLRQQVAELTTKTHAYEAMAAQLRLSDTTAQYAEQRYRTLFDGAPIMYVITRLQADIPLITDCNHLFLSMLGYRRIEVIGQPLANFYTSASQAQMLNGGYWRAIAQQFPPEERGLLTRDGRVIQTMLHALPETDNTGQVIGTRAMYVDITQRKQTERELQHYQDYLAQMVDERTTELAEAINYLEQEIIEHKEAEEAVRASEVFLHSTLDALTTHIAILDHTGVITAVNEAWRHFGQVNGWSCSDYGLGLNYITICATARGDHSAEGPRVAAGLRAVIHHELDEFQLEYPCYSPGLRRWFNLRATRFSIGGQTKVVVAHENITQQKLIQETLRTKQAELQTIHDASPIGIFLTDEPGNCIYTNQAYQRISGLSLEQAMGTGWNRAIHPEDRARVVQEWAEAARSDRPYESIHRFLRPDDQIIWTSVKVAAIRIEDRTTGYVGTVEDITKRKQAEETLRQYNLDLQARNEELDAFAHTVAHDLKNLLTMILGYSEVLREDLAAMQLPNVEASLEAIARNSHKMENIIGEILLLAGVRKKEIKLEVLDMADIVAEACQRLTWMVEVQQAEIVLPTTWPTALGYGPWIEEVWVNYLSNGLKYGGLPPHLKLGGMIQDDGMVRFWVGDNGAGLTLEEQARLFSQFTRLDQARTKGHGLGLSIVRRIVEKLGGQVGIESAGIPGQGSTFYFTLPRAG